MDLSERMDPIMFFFSSNENFISSPGIIDTSLQKKGIDETYKKRCPTIRTDKNQSII